MALDLPSGDKEDGAESGYSYIKKQNSKVQVLEDWNSRHEVSKAASPYGEARDSWLVCIVPMLPKMVTTGVINGMHWLSRHQASLFMRESYPIFNWSRVSLSPQKVSGRREPDAKMEREMCWCSSSKESVGVASCDERSSMLEGK